MNLNLPVCWRWLLLVCAAFIPYQVLGAASASTPINRLIVKYADSDQRSPSVAEQQQRAAQTARQLTGLAMRYAKALPDGAVLLDLPYAMSREEAWIYARNLSQSDQVIYAEPDAWRRPLLTPNDALYASSQWHLQSASSNPGAANLPSAWDLTIGNNSIVVAIVDTGALNHTDLDSRFVGGSAAASGRDFISDLAVSNDSDGRDNDPTDPGDASDGANCNTSVSSWHGTHIAGTIGAETNNAAGVAGIDWNAKLLTVRALGVCGGPASDVNDAIRWAAGETIDGVTNPNPAKVINLSLGGEDRCLTSEQTAIDAAVARGAVVVVAAGNENTDVANSSPANCENVITVAALQQNGARASFSNFGEEVDIAAPGASIWSTSDSGTITANNDNIYFNHEGTSMAAAHVSGVVSLMLASNTSLANASGANVSALVEARLKAFARSFPTGTGLDCTTSTCGAGMLDAYQAISGTTTSSGTDSSSSGGGGSFNPWYILFIYVLFGVLYARKYRSAKSY